MKDEYFSSEHEPALTGGRFEPDPAERKAAPVGTPPSELEALRDSVANEPALPEHLDASRWPEWLARRRSQCTPAGNLSITLAAALLGGPFAILGALLTQQRGIAFLVYPILFAPIIEELLKQSGMIYLVEKRPYRVFASWQFVFAAVVSALTFASIENLVYIQVHSLQASAEDVARVARFRWPVCTSLHVICAIIASGGMIRVWRKQLREGRPAKLSDAFGFFAAAMIVHGVYNTWAIFWGPEF
jgi:RsiW-degrading membrane proteinase PrsW (M82 family)